MLEIVKSPNAILLQKAKECVPGDKELKKLANQMIKLMYKYSGIGLAGPQVAKDLRIIVIEANCNLFKRQQNEDQQESQDDDDDQDIPQNPLALINPEIDKKSDEMIESSEGCLSCPGIMAPVMRHKSVEVKYFDLDGNPQSISADGLLSCCLQHEIDHLDGKTLFQTAKPEVRLDLLKDYELAINAGLEPGQFLD